jgi:hypothetical protein
MIAVCAFFCTAGLGLFSTGLARGVWMTGWVLVALVFWERNTTR